MPPDTDINYKMQRNTLADDNRQGSVEVRYCTRRDHLLITTLTP